MTKKFDILAVADAWEKLVASIGQVRAIRSNEDLARTATVLDALLEAVEDDEASPLHSLIDLLSELIETFETRRLHEPNAPPATVLRLLMDSNGLKQTDLAGEVGGQSVVSSILSGRREINARQARALGARFGVSPAIFIGPTDPPGVEVAQTATVLADPATDALSSLTTKWVKEGFSLSGGIATIIVPLQGITEKGTSDVANLVFVANTRRAPKAAGRRPVLTS
ncbi:MAG: helix-turn-helix domain-containing protein [Rubrivivax sp.]|nr:helix-turn-helix domain-containing protein [Rubrivivax sp.]